MEKYSVVYSFPIGKLRLTEEAGALTQVAYQFQQSEPEVSQWTPLLKEAIRQLEEYFSGKRKEFQLPLRLNGTEFQKKVWQALLEIPYGETRSYSQIAERIGNSKAVRAVGMANHVNPVMIIVPCHRVIGKNGGLTGYGYGIEIKEALLHLEGCL